MICELFLLYIWQAVLALVNKGSGTPPESLCDVTDMDRHSAVKGRMGKNKEHVIFFVYV